MGCSWDARFCVSTQAFLRNYFDLPSFFFSFPAVKNFYSWKSWNIKRRDGCLCVIIVFIYFCAAAHRLSSCEKGSSVLRMSFSSWRNMPPRILITALPYHQTCSSVLQESPFGMPGKPLPRDRKSRFCSWNDICLWTSDSCAKLWKSAYFRPENCSDVCAAFSRSWDWMITEHRWYTCREA